MQIKNRKVLAAVKKAADNCGGLSKLAKRLGIRRQTLYQWERVPVLHVLTIEELSGVSRHTLRPDVFGKQEAA